MEIFSIIYLIVSILVIIFLSIRCVVLTKAAAVWTGMIQNLLNDDYTRDNIKIIAAALYGINVKELDRRLKDEH